MTTISDLPEEVLYMIFKQTRHADLSQCQQVSRVWYLPAHKVFLKTVRLQNGVQIEQFIKSIDHNPDPQYLAAVKKIIIFSDDYKSPNSQYKLSKKIIKKLFFRFPNLETVESIDASDFKMYSEFNDKLCEELLRNCPKLSRFNGPYDEVFNYDHLLKLRRVITTLQLPNMHETVHERNSVSYVAGFSRLQALDINSRNLNSFEKFLPVFQQLPYLDDLRFTRAQPDQDNFLKQYLSTKTKHEQDVLLERLSKVTCLSCSDWSPICENALDFITKYLNGLYRLHLSVSFTTASTNTQRYQSFCISMLNLLGSIKDCHVDILFRINDLSEYLALILRKVYQQAAKTGGKTPFEVYVTNSYTDLRALQVKLRIWQGPGGQSMVNVTVHEDNLANLVENVFSKPGMLDDVNYLKIHPYGIRYIDVSFYEKVIDCMKSLKHVFLEVPSSFGENKTMHYTYNQEYDGKVYPQVMQMTIKSKENVKYQTLLNKFFFAFPNIQQLTLNNHCGYWRQYLGEFELILCKYSLKHLKVDVTPIKEMMQQFLKKQCTSVEDFFVLEVECMKTSERFRYKVSPYNLDTTRINGNELKGLIRGKDYLRLNITVDSLKQLELHIDNSIQYGTHVSDYDYIAFKHVIKIND